MNLFVIGDVHGCFRTFKTLLENWKPEEEILIQLGDLINRGNHNPQTIKLAREIKEKYPDTSFFLKGNHEYELIEHSKGKTNEKWYNKGGGKKLLWQYHIEERDFADDALWCSKMPLYWENEHVFVSHAGISKTDKPFDEDNEDGVIWNRKPLKNIKKLQLIGHTPLKKFAEYENESNSWNLDTGAVYGGRLTGLKLTADGEIIDFFSVVTFATDFK